MMQSNYRPIYFEPNYAKEKYHGWSEVFSDDRFKVLERNYGFVTRRFAMAWQMSPEEIEAAMLKHRLLSQFSIVIVHDFSTQTTSEKRVFCGKSFELLKSKRRLTNTNTFIIDLKESTEVLWSKMHANAKGTCKKAESSGMTVTFSNQPSNQEIDHFFQLYARMAKERNLEMPSRKITLAMIDQRNLITAICRNPLGEIVTINTVYITNDHAIYFQGVSGADKNKTVGQYVQWETIKHLQSLGLHWYDLGGVPSTDPSDGIYKFKNSLGGNFVSLGVEYQHMPSILKFPEMLYRKLRTH